MVEFRSKLDSSKSRALNNNMFKKLLWLYAGLTVLLIVFGVIGIVLKEDSSDVAAGIGTKRRFFIYSQSQVFVSL